VCSELQTNPDLIQDIVRVAVATLTERDAVQVRLGDPAYDRLQAARESLVEALRGLEVKVVHDPSVGPGCIVEARSGRVDMRIEERLRAAREALQAAHAAARGESP
jgi:flagellar biosynthesis/type III secretory pathway protein FliH